MLNRREILIIEDNPADVRLMQEALRGMEPPVHVHLVGDGDEALRFLRRQGSYANVPTPSLIFLDLSGSGVEFLETAPRHVLRRQHSTTREVWMDFGNDDLA